MKNRKIKSDTLAVAIDVVVLSIEHDELKVLLIKRARDPYKEMWALPGGFLKNKESLETAAQRVLKEKGGIKHMYLEQLYTFDSSGRDPRGHVPTIAYLAMLPRNTIKIKETSETQNPTFFTIKNLPGLAFDHRSIIGYALKRIRAKLEYTNIAFSLLPRQFTLTQLQNVYEIILNKDFDKRNFRKKVISLELIKPTPKIFTGAHQRPARLYRFVFQKPMEAKKFLK